MLSFLKYFILFLTLFSQTLYAETSVDEFPSDLQLYPRDRESNYATVSVSGVIKSPHKEVSLKVYRADVLWDSVSHLASQSENFEFTFSIPAELAEFDFELSSTDEDDVQVQIASAEGVVAGDVFVINGQSNAASGIYSVAGPGNDDANDFVRSFGSTGTDRWIDDNNWSKARPECRPLQEQTGCLGRWGLRLANNIVTTEQVPIAVINSAEGGKEIAYFQRNDTDVDDLDTNYGRLLTRLNQASVVENIRGLLWYQGEADRLNAEGHIDLFSELFLDWQEQFPSIEKYYIFQIRHTCLVADLVTGQGSGISNFQREFANDRTNVTALSTTALDGHNGCHFAYENGYQQLGDNVSRTIRRDLYDQAFNDADAADITSAILTEPNQVILTFTDNNTLIADNGFEALFELRNGDNDQLYSIIDGAVLSGESVLLTTTESIEEGSNLVISYFSKSGDQNWLTNLSGIGIQSFIDVPVTTVEEEEPPQTSGEEELPQTPEEENSSQTSGGGSIGFTMLLLVFFRIRRQCRMFS